MSNERDRPTAKHVHPSTQEVLNGQPRQVAQVNMLPDEPLNEEYEESPDAADPPALGSGAPVAESGSVGGGWSPMAWLLGLLALAISIGVLIFVLQGVFQSMPS
jgi:hypothetical protein